MHPIFQWLDYQYDDYGGFARITDERCIGGFKNRLIAGSQPAQRRGRRAPVRQRAGCDEGCAAVDARSTTSKNFTAYVENSFYFLPDVALVAGTQYPARDARPQRPVPLQRRPVGQHATSTSGAPRSACCGTWTAPGRSSPTSRAAPRCRASARTSFTSIAFSDIKAQTATTYEIGTRGRRPDYTWDFAALPGGDRQRAAVPVQRVRQLHGRQRRPARCTRASRSASASAVLKSHLRARRQRRTSCGSTSPTRSTTSTSTTMPSSATTSCRERPALPARRAALQASAAASIFGPNVEWVPEAYYVDSANTLKTEAYAIWGAQARLRQRRAVHRLHRGPQPLRRGLHRQRQHHRHGRRRPCPCSSRARAARSTAA